MVAEPFEGKSILVVDDDPDIVQAIKAVFDDMGAAVSTAGDGNTAIDLATSDHPDLVVLDAMLPGRSGFLVLEQLKRLAKDGGSCPGIIMITGNQGKRHQAWAESLGVDAYINKPFRMERLIQSAERLLCS
jgi:CheY-like chemotaxis protein